MNRDASVDQIALNSAWSDLVISGYLSRLPRDGVLVVLRILVVSRGVSSNPAVRVHSSLMRSLYYPSSRFR